METIGRVASWHSSQDGMGLSLRIPSCEKGRFHQGFICCSVPRWVSHPQAGMLATVVLLIPPLKETAGGEFRVYEASVRLLEGI